MFTPTAPMRENLDRLTRRLELTAPADRPPIQADITATRLRIADAHNANRAHFHAWALAEMETMFAHLGGVETALANDPTLQAAADTLERMQEEARGRLAADREADRCPMCGGTDTHGLIHTRHPEGGGGSNRPCPGGANV